MAEIFPIQWDVMIRVPAVQVGSINIVVCTNCFFNFFKQDNLFNYSLVIFERKSGNYN